MPLDNQIIVPKYFSGNYTETVLTPQQISAVALTGNQTVSGTKTFASRPTVNGTGILLSGEASSLPNTVVYTTGNQTITGLKSFSDVTVTNKITLRNVETSWGGLGSGVYFSQPDNSATQIIDYIDTNLSITRGNVQSIYNAALENAWNGSGPSGTRWNRSGYDDLGNVASRTYDSLLNTFAGAIGGNIVGSPLVMHDAINNKYYKILFNNWQQGGAAAGTYAGFSYTRWLIVNPTYPYPTVSGEKLNFKNKTEFDIRPIVKGTGVLLSGEVVAQLPNTIVYTTGNQTISGAKTFVNGIVAPNLVYNTGNQTISGDKTFNDGILFNKGDMPIGYLTGSFNEFLEANYLTLGVYPFSGNEGYIKLDYLGNGLQIGEDGIRLINNGLGGATYISSNTNNALFLQHPSIYINSTQTLFNSRPTVNYSGVLLEGEIPTLPNTIVYTTGNQTVSGIKTFASRPTVNGTGVLLSGEAAQLDLSSTVRTTGDQTISGIKTFNNGLITSSISGVFGTGLNIQAGSGTSVINAGDLILMGGNLSGFPNILKSGASITIGGAKALGGTSNITIRPSIDPSANAGNIVLEAGLSPTYNGKINMFGDINVNGTSDVGTALSSKNINIYRRGVFLSSPSQRLAISIDNDNVDFQNGMGLRVSGIQVTPSAYVTGSVVRPSETGVFYPGSNPSGFITSQNVVYTFGDQIISGTKYFNNSVYIHDLYVTGTEFIATVQNNFIESPYILLNLTGGAIDGGIFFVTGAGLTGVNDYGPIIGFDHSNKFKFGTARRSDDLSILNDIAAVQDITNYSGFVDNNFYAKNNPSGFITGVNLSNYVTKTNGEFTNRPTVNGTGILLSGEAAQLPGTIVYTSGTQTISGVKTFATGIDIFNETSPQSLRIFNTTGTNSGEFGQIGWSGNTFVIGTVKSASGIARNLALQRDGLNHIRFLSDEITSIGRVTTMGGQGGVYLNPPADQASIGSYLSSLRAVTNASELWGSNSNSTSSILFLSCGQGLIRLGGTNSNFPALKRSGVNLQLRLADDSNFTNFEANKLIANSGADIYFSGTAGTGVSGSHVGVLVSGLWNNTGQIYTGVRYNITLGSGIVPSATNSLLNVSVNNTGVFSIDSRGYARITKNSSVIDYSYPLTVRRATTDLFTVRDDGSTEAIGFSTPLQAGHSSMNADGFAVRSVGSFRISSDVAAFSPDVFLRRDGPGIFSQYNGINPQQYRIYNATGTNSGEFGVFGWQRTGASGTPNAFVIGAQATQNGTLRNVAITGANISVNPAPWVTGTEQYNAFGINITPTNHDYRSTLFSINNTQGSPIFGVQGAAGYALNQKVRIFGDQRGIVFGPRQTSAGGGSDFVSMRWQTSQVQLLHGTEIGWSQSPFDVGADLTIFRDAADTLAQRRGLSPQQFRVYNLTGTNSGEFGVFGWRSAPNALVIGTQTTQSGTLRDVVITGANISLASSGVIIPNPTVPTSTGSEGSRGQISWDNDFIYVCVSGNSWKRSALTTW